MKEQKQKNDFDNELEQSTEIDSPDAVAVEVEQSEACEVEPSLELQLERLLAENESLKNQYLRSIADYANLKQRTDRDRKDILNQANAKLTGKLLPVIDNFERALGSIVEKEVAEGVGKIYKQLLDILQNAGLEKIDSEGQQFDPHVHEALMQEHNAEVKDNTVLQVFESGYRFKNKLLRAAKVKVSSN